MPTYLYRCNQCDHEFETRQRMSDDPLTECPVCGGDIRRVVGSVGIVFKGKGFYVTDHRKSNGGGRVQTPGESSTSDDGSSKPVKETKKGSDAGKSSSDSGTKASATTSSTAAAPGNSQ